MATHVLSEDTVFREVRDNGKVLYSRRFLTKTNKLPKWGERWMPANLYRFVPLVEESYVDRDNKTVTTYTRNVGLSTFMTATERVLYQPNPDNPEETIALKEAWVESRLYGLRTAVKNFGIERFKNNCSRATEGFNHVLIQFHEKHQYLTELKHRKSLEIKAKGEQALKEAGLRATSHIFKAADIMQATRGLAAAKGRAAIIKASDMASATKGRYKCQIIAKLNLKAEENRCLPSPSSILEK